MKIEPQSAPTEKKMTPSLERDERQRQNVNCLSAAQSSNRFGLTRRRYRILENGVADADLIIVGAGVAGLAAARELHRAGAKVLILEARDRIGGRILTRREDAVALPNELGAEFIHGRPPSIFDLIAAAGLSAVEIFDHRLFFDDGALRPLDNFWEIIAAVDKQIDPSADVTYEDFLESAQAPAFHKLIAKSYVEGFNAANAALISAPAIALADRAAERIDGQRQFRLPAGYDSVVHELAKVLPEDCLRREHVVREVKWKRRQVEVRCVSRGDEVRLHAGSLITTLPLALLRLHPDQRGGVHFDPPLTAKWEALTRLQVGQVVKVIMHFRERFWEDPGVVGAPIGVALCRDALFPTVWTMRPLAENVLIAWAGGPAAERLLGRPPAALRASAINSLSTTFRTPAPRIASQLMAFHFHDWSADPFARGAYTYPGVGGIKAAQTLSEPLAGTLFFAGEATDFEGANGTVHGAIESGYRAAREFLAMKSMT